MKKILLIFAILFAPTVLYADGVSDFSNNSGGGYTITSSEVLTKKFLPLDSDILSEAVEKTIMRSIEEPICLLSITDDIVEGKFRIPFSAQDLLTLCRKRVFNPRTRTHSYACESDCTYFTLYYMQKIIEKNDHRKVLQKKAHDYIWQKK